MMGIGVGLIGDKGGDILSIASKNNTNGLALRHCVEFLKSSASIDNINGLPFWQRLC